MIRLAFAIGIFAYSIFILGVIGVLYPAVIIAVSLVYWLGFFLIFRKEYRPSFSLRDFSRSEKVLLSLFTLQALVALIGVFGPEIGFDALWYHLTFPKLYLLHHAIIHIPGNLFYYSESPKLTELLYTAALVLGNETLAKLIHFLFGIATCYALYRFSRRYLSGSSSLLVVLIFSSNLVFGWESIASYIDLARTFFEFLAFVMFVRWTDEQKSLQLTLSSLLLGLAVATKLLALSSLPIFLALIVWVGLKNQLSVGQSIRNLVLFTIGTIIVPLPWFVSSYRYYGDPFYPYFTALFPKGEGYGTLSPLQFGRNLWGLLVSSADPISPLYLISLPIIIFSLARKDFLLRMSSLYAGLALLIWYIIPKIGGGRFILPYLPVFSFLVMYSLTNLKSTKLSSWLSRCLLFLVVFYAGFFILYRGYANMKFIPYLLGRESKATFLASHLNFSFGDFYDTDGYLGKTITPRDKALLIGFHNLYYVDFPFIDSSFMQKGDRFNYILTQNTILPIQYRYWNLLYTNPITHVSLYGNGGMMWEY